MGAWELTPILRISLSPPLLLRASSISFSTASRRKRSPSKMFVLPDELAPMNTVIGVRFSIVTSYRLRQFLNVTLVNTRLSLIYITPPPPPPTHGQAADNV